MKIGYLAIVALAACGGTARNSDAYRADTLKLLETHRAQVTACYDEALKADRKLAGTVMLHFTVEKKTGAFGQVAVDPGKSTAPSSVWPCVMRVVEGLQLQPADKNEGQATFVYELAPAKS